MSPLPAGKPAFSTTQWSLVVSAGDSRCPDSGAALEELCRTYWYPVYAYVRRRGTCGDEAQDLAQGFFSHILEKRSLRVARPERGRFRSFLLTSLKNYLANEWDREKAQKRGGTCEKIAIDARDAQSRYALEPVDDARPDTLFERKWASVLLQQALVRLRDEESSSASSPRRRTDRLIGVLTGEAGGVRYRKIAEELEMTEGAVRVAVHRMRRRYGQLLREEVARTMATPDQVDEELRYLMASLVP